MPAGTVGNGVDCDDADRDVHPGATDLCGDGRDDDCDGIDRPCPAPGDVLITEVMADPAALGDTAGEWFELYNATSAPVELGGLVIRDEGGDRHVIAGSVIVEPRTFAVLVRATGATSSWRYVYGGSMSLGNDDDELILATPSDVVISRVAWPAGFVTRGASASLDPGAFTASGAADLDNWCDSTSAYFTGDRGTPGESNDPCAGSGVSGVSPGEGLGVGGLEVTITGLGFSGATAVLFGTAAAPSFHVVSDSEVAATTPPHAAGWVDVTVRTPGGDLTLRSAFLYTGTGSDIDWCNVQWPRATTTAAGTPTELIFGQVFRSGTTEVAPACGEGIIAQIGVGPIDSDPSTSHAWTWSVAACNPSCADCGFNDEYMSTLTVETAGEYAFAYRFSSDEGINYRYCDTSGSMDGDPYAVASQGRLTVTAP
jgi:hypothetical protein